MLYIGSNNYPIQLNIDLDSKYTILYSDPSNRNFQSETIKICNWKREIEYNSEFAMSNEARDKFINSSSSAVDLSFFIIDCKPTTKYGLIEIATSFYDENYSLINQLKRNKLISRLSFSLIVPFNNQIYLAFGQKAHKNSKYCDITETGSSRWSCEFKELFIQFNDENSVDYFLHVNTVNASARFSLKEYNILIPTVIYEELIDHVFFKATNSDQCEYSYNKYTKIKELKCLCSIREKFIDVHFQFKNMWFCLNDTDLFWYSNFYMNKCIFNVGINPNDDGWIFGYAFIKHFDTVFDYKDKKVYFYRNEETGSKTNNDNDDNDNTIRNNSNNISIKIRLIVVCLFILITNASILGYIKCTIIQKQ